MKRATATTQPLEIIGKLSPIVGQIVEKFHPQQVILFGSQARQDAHRDSDIDLLVVMETAQKSTAQAVDILRALNYQRNLDLIVRTPQMLQERLKLGDSFLKDVMAEGIVLYAKSDS